MLHELPPNSNAFLLVLQEFIISMFLFLIDSKHIFVIDFWINSAIQYKSRLVLRYLNNL